MAAGVFISIEGGEGVGKTVFTQGLKDALESQGVHVALTREPGGTPTAQAIRSLFMNPPKDDPLAPMTELLLVSAARHQHVVKFIEPQIKVGNWVICDRFADSTRAYQGILGGIDSVKLEAIIKMSVADCSPQITFLLDCDVSIAQKRLMQRDLCAESGNRYDAASLSFHESLRAAFLTLAAENKSRIFILDSSQEAEVVIEQALAIIRKKFGSSFE